MRAYIPILFLLQLDADAAILAGRFLLELAGQRLRAKDNAHAFFLDHRGRRNEPGLPLRVLSLLR